MTKGSMKFEKTAAFDRIFPVRDGFVPLLTWSYGLLKQ